MTSPCGGRNKACLVYRMAGIRCWACGLVIEPVVAKPPRSITRDMCQTVLSIRTGRSAGAAKIKLNGIYKGFLNFTRYAGDLTLLHMYVPSMENWKEEYSCSLCFNTLQLGNVTRNIEEHVGIEYIDRDCWELHCLLRQTAFSFKKRNLSKDSEASHLTAGMDGKWSAAKVQFTKQNFEKCFTGCANCDGARAQTFQSCELFVCNLCLPTKLRDQNELSPSVHVAF